jgi:hypothetical protein
MVGTGTGVGDGDGDGDGEALGEGDCAWADETATSTSAQASITTPGRLRPIPRPSRCNGCDEQHIMLFPNAKKPLFH